VTIDAMLHMTGPRVGLAGFQAEPNYDKCNNLMKKAAK
jgi:hypothetical protein